MERDSMAAVTQSEPIRPEDLRAGDGDRERVVERLRRAQSDGRIDVFEFDERVAEVYRARTFGDLATVTADLPVADPAPARTGAVAPVPRAGVEGGGGIERAAVAAWLGASLVNLVIWGIVGVASGSFVYPWWIWVAGPWGAVLLARWISGRVAGR